MPEDVREAIHANGITAVQRMTEIITDPNAFGKGGWLPAREQLQLIEIACNRAFGRPDTAPPEVVQPVSSGHPPNVLALLDSAVRALDAESQRPVSRSDAQPRLVTSAALSTNHPGDSG